MAHKEWLEIAMKTNLIDLVQENKLLETGEFSSAHFDDLNIEFDQNLRGEELIFFAHQLLKSVVSLIGSSDSGDRQISVFIHLPLPISQELKLWDANEIHELTVLNEPPSVYIFNGHDFLPLDNEEYRFPFFLISPSGDQISCHYRCFRTPQGVENAWEFERGFGVYQLRN